MSRPRRALAALAALTLAHLAIAAAPAARAQVPRGAAAPVASPAAANAAAPAIAERLRSDSAYIALLERLNDQLGWRWNPINVTVTLMAGVVAVLGLVFAGGTVVAGWLLYRQSREFREQSEQSIREHRAVLGAIVETWRRESDAAFEARMAEFDKSIAEQQAKLSALAGASTEQRLQAERDLERLKRERDAASASEMEKLAAAGVPGAVSPGPLAFTGTFPIPGRRLSGFVASDRRFCTSCGREFPVPESPPGTAEPSITGAREVFCAHCGAKNRV